MPVPFGFGISDFVAVGDLAWRIYLSCMTKLYRSNDGTDKFQAKLPRGYLQLSVGSLSRCTVFWKRLPTPNYPTLYHLGKKLD